MRFRHVVCSAERPFCVFPRAQTAVVDAYVGPVVNAYLSGVQSALGRVSHVMTSAGGLLSAADCLKTACLAAQLEALSERLAGRRHDRVISLIWAYSTDVARFDGEHEYAFEHEVGDAHLVAPAQLSRPSQRVGALFAACGMVVYVGPESAGTIRGQRVTESVAADPDGRQLAFGTVRRRDGIPIHREHAEARLAETAAALRRGGGQVPSREALLAGFIEIADERMADAIRRISLQKGYDPVDYALVAFGGAGAQHACGGGAPGNRRSAGAGRCGFAQCVGYWTCRDQRFAEKQALQPLEILGDRLEAMVHQVEREALSVRGEGSVKLLCGGGLWKCALSVKTSRWP